MELLIHLGSVLVLAVIAESLCRLGRLRPALCHALWLVVLVKLMVPPVVSWPTDRLDLASYLPAPPPVTEASGERADRGTAVARASAGNGSAAEAPSTTTVPTESAAFDYRGSLLMAAVALWLAGSLTVLLRLVWRVGQGRLLVSAGSEAPPWLAEQLQDACASLGVPTPRMTVVQSDCGGVYVHFFGRPTVAVSNNALEEIERDQWPAILTHELAHLKRKDHWVARLLLVASVLWWWNPGLWWARNRLHLYSELACDAWVVRTRPDERKSYAETMVRILALRNTNAMPAPAMGLAVWPAAAQKRRLEMVMNGNSRCTLGWIPATATLLAAMALAPGWYATAEDKTAPPAGDAPAAQAPAEPGWVLDLSPAQRVQNTLDAAVNIEFEDIHIQDVLEFIQDSFEINAVLDGRVVPPEPKSDGEPGVEQANPAASDRYITDGMVGYLNLKNTSLDEAFSAMLESLNLTHKAVGGTVWISSPEQLVSDSRVAPPSSKQKTSELIEKLRSPINIEFENIHLKDILAFLQDSFEVNIILDNRVVMPEGGDWNKPPIGSPGYVTDGMINYINLKDIPLGEVLYHMARLVDLTYTVEKGYVFISTPELVAEAKKPDRVE